MQPLDASIICAFKRHYQRLHVTELVRQLDENPTKKPVISLKDAIYFVILAWKCVTAETVQNCWRHAGVYPKQGEVQVVDTTDGAEQNEEIEALIHRIPDLVDPMTATEFIQFGDDEPIGAEMTDGEIISIVTGCSTEVEEAGEEDEINEEVFEKPPPSRQDARAGLQTALAYFELNSDTFADFMPQIKKMICKIDEYGVKMAKQTSILNYFELKCLILIE